MQRNIKIIFVSHGNTTNGGELCLADTVKALIDKGGYEIYVLIPGPPGSLLAKIIDDNGAIVKPVFSNSRWVDHPIGWKEKLTWLKTTGGTYLRFSKMLREIKPDYVVTNTIVSNPAFAIASKLHGYRHAWYIHELGDKDHGYKYYFGKRLTWSLVNLLSDRVIINSHFTLRYFTNKKIEHGSKRKIIYYGVPVERLKINDTDFDEAIINKWNGITKWNILVAGRTVKGKGQEDIITAIAIIKNEYKLTNFHLKVVGQVSGEYNDKLLQLIKESGLEEFVDMIPFSEHPGKYFKEAHIGVTTSRNEAFGRITVEYMKSNMVTVGANAGATNEIIQNNINGYCYEPGDISQFAKILVEIMSDAGNAKTVAWKGKTEIEQRFNLARHGAEVNDFLFN